MDRGCQSIKRLWGRTDLWDLNRISTEYVFLSDLQFYKANNKALRNLRD